jgi:hypothetical protein
VLCQSVAGLWIRVPWPASTERDGPTDHRSEWSFQPSGATTDDVGSTVEAAPHRGAEPVGRVSDFRWCAKATPWAACMQPGWDSEDGARSDGSVR